MHNDCRRKSQKSSRCCRVGLLPSAVFSHVRSVPGHWDPWEFVSECADCHFSWGQVHKGWVRLVGLTRLLATSQVIPCHQEVIFSPDVQMCQVPWRNLGIKTCLEFHCCSFFLFKGAKHRCAFQICLSCYFRSFQSLLRHLLETTYFHIDGASCVIRGACGWPEVGACVVSNARKSLFCRCLCSVRLWRLVWTILTLRCVFCTWVFTNWTSLFAPPVAILCRCERSTAEDLQSSKPFDQNFLLSLWPSAWNMISSRTPCSVALQVDLDFYLAFAEMSFIFVLQCVEFRSWSVVAKSFCCRFIRWCLKMSWLFCVWLRCSSGDSGMQTVQLCRFLPFLRANDPMIDTLCVTDHCFVLLPFLSYWHWLQIPKVMVHHMWWWRRLEWGSFTCCKNGMYQRFLLTLDVDVSALDKLNHSFVGGLEHEPKTLEITHAHTHTHTHTCVQKEILNPRKLF